MNTKSIICSIALAFAGNLLYSAPAQKPFHENTWSLQGGVFYVDHTGGDLSFSCKATQKEPKVTPATGAASRPAILVTIYTPDEHIYRDFYWQDNNDRKTITFSCKIPKAQKGIWQIRVSQDERSKFTYKFDLAPGKIKAVLPTRCWLWHQAGKMFDKTYVLTPKILKKDLRVTVYNCEIEFIDPEGKSTGKMKKSTTLKLKPDTLYQYRNTTKAPGWNWSGYLGYPVIFCSTAEFAKRLNASQIELPNGKIVALGVQKRIEEWKKTLTKKDFEVPEVDLQKFKTQLIADPESQGLLDASGLLSAAPFLLSVQDVDPASPKFGSARGDIGGLALLYSLNKPWNPYYKCRGLLNRVALYYLDFQVNHPTRALKENGTKYETSSNYAGADGMLQVPEATAFYLLSKDLPENVRQMWTETFGYPTRRFFSDRVSCENQSGHWPAKLYLYGKATDNPMFVKMAENYIRNLADTSRGRFIRTGYLQEAYGPDATYQGLNTCLLAYYAMHSKDPEAYKLLDRIYTLFNHTVVPDPDTGKFYGASGFSHRTPGGWNIRQYGGGTRLTADKLASAACWHQDKSKNPAWTSAYYQRYLKWAADKKLNYYKSNPAMAFSYTFMPYARVWHMCPKIPVRTDSVLPVAASDNFERSFADEFHFFRRKTYYSGVYTGKTATYSAWQKQSKPFPGKWVKKNGIMVAQNHAIFGALQGPQLFWTPDYGLLLISMNWNLYSRWNAWLTDGKTQDWPSYFTSTTKYDPVKKEILLTHKFRKTPCTIERKLVFEKKDLTVSLKTNGDHTGKKLMEQLPFLSKKGVSIAYCINNKWQNTPGSKVTALRWKNKKNAAVLLKFSRPVTVRKGITSRSQVMTLESLEIEIGTAGQKGFSYSISAE